MSAHDHQEFRAWVEAGKAVLRRILEFRAAPADLRLRSLKSIAHFNTLYVQQLEFDLQPPKKEGQ